MLIEATVRIPNELRTCIVCIDSYENGAITGKIVHPCFSEPFQFNNIIVFLKLMEMLFDMFEYPQASTKRRSYQSKIQKIIESKNLQPFMFEMKDEVNKLNGRVATLQLRVIFRQNTSWQGTVHWMERNKKENFRSFLELLMLIDSIFDEPSQEVRSEMKMNRPFKKAVL